MQQAITLATQAQSAGEVPIGAVLVLDDKVIGIGRNRVIENHDPTAHAECEALRAAARFLSNYRLPDTTLYVTIEPCLMCVGAMVHARIKQLVFGAREPKAGAVISNVKAVDLNHWNHTVAYSEGVLESECRKLIQDFFRSCRVA